MLTVGLSLKGTSLKEETKELFARAGLSGDGKKIAEDLATLLLGRVRRRFRTQQNPDGRKWKETKAARIRKAGGYTFAEGGQYAPGGMKTAGDTLFSSGNLFHSIQLKKLGVGKFAILTDVPYAVFWQNDEYTIIGTTENEVDAFLEAIFRRIL